MKERFFYRDENIASGTIALPPPVRRTDTVLTNVRRKVFRYTSYLLIGAVIIFLAAMVRAYLSGEFRSVEALQDYFGRFGIWGPVFLTAFQALQVVIPVLPACFGCAAGSMLFGTTVGFLCNYTGIVLGSVIAFYLARRIGEAIIKDLFPDNKYDKWSKRLSESKYYSLFLFLGMILPLVPGDYLCYLTGITKMTARRFFWIIALGRPWWILAYCLGFSLIK